MIKVESKPQKGSKLQSLLILFGAVCICGVIIYLTTYSILEVKWSFKQTEKSTILLFSWLEEKEDFHMTDQGVFK